MITFKLQGWAPDADPNTPGIVTEVEMMEPTVRGLRAAASAVDVETTALAAECKGASLITRLDGTQRLFAGTDSAIYEASGASWIPASSATYTGTGDARWEFRQYGDLTLATNGVDDPQYASATTFSALSAMPICKIVEVASGFVMAANISDASHPYPDGWWCSALYDPMDWTPSIATQSARGRITDSPGPITAVRALGGDLVFFKERSITLARYIGPDLIWAFQRVPGDVGAPSQQGVVTDGTALFFWGGDDFYRFDGTRAQPIGEAVRRWFEANANGQALYKMIGQYDRQNSLVRWFFCGRNSTTPDRCIVYHTRTGRWGRADREIEAVVEYVPLALTYETPGQLAGATYNSLAYAQSYDSPLWAAGAGGAAFIDTSHVVRLLSGAGEASSLTTGSFGDDERLLLLRKVRARYSSAPTTASMTNFYTNGSGEDLIEDGTVTGEDRRFDVLRAARWHRLTFAWTGPVEISDIVVDAVPTGTR